MENGKMLSIKKKTREGRENEACSGRREREKKLTIEREKRQFSRHSLVVLDI